MIRRILNRLKRRPEQADAIPAECMAALEVASIVQRHGGDEGRRILVQLGVGGATFWHDAATDGGRLADIFGLTEQQAARAARYLANRVHAQLRKSEHDATMLMNKPAGWATWRPYSLD